MQQMQEASEQMARSQQELWQQFMQASAGGETMSDLTALSRGAAMFKTRVQSGGRISIPDAEREALDIGEGDIVQTIVIPIRRSDTDE
jgi:hypothetical protein